MREVNVYGGGVEFVQTWEITAVGTVPGALAATVEVTAMLEQDTVDAETFAVFATADTCGAITYSGSGGTNSYNSTSMTLAGTPPKPVTADTGGAIGTNGNLNIGGSIAVYGALYTPRSGVGSCSSGAVTAVTGSVASVSQGLVSLPQAKVYPTPVIPPSGTVGDDDWSFHSSASQADCQALFNPKSWNCTLNTVTNTWTISPQSVGIPLPLGNVSLRSNQNLVIAGTGSVKLNWNTFTVQGNTALSITNSLTELNLTGSGVTPGGPVMDFEGNFSTTAFDPSKFQILYAGTDEIKLRGNNELAATIYAPNAYVTMSSSYDVYGSILSKTFSNTGGAMVHYDTSLSAKYKTLGNRVMSSFSWKKY